jgi:hypothetical protein
MIQLILSTPNGRVPLDSIWDAGNIIYDLLSGDPEALAADVAALALLYIPAGITKICKLKRIYSDETIKRGSGSYDYWKQQKTEDIVELLKPDPKNPDSLKVYPDGSIVDGNTRTLILEERGYDINSLPREFRER